MLGWRSAFQCHFSINVPVMRVHGERIQSPNMVEQADPDGFEVTPRADWDGPVSQGTLHPGDHRVVIARVSSHARA
jgi:hypothetical protein